MLKSGIAKSGKNILILIIMQGNVYVKHVFSIWKTFQYLEQLFQGEEAFLISNTWQEFTYKSKWISKHGREGYPLKRIKET